MKLIDGDKLTRELANDYACIIAEFVDSQPAVDAVPVIRCKDCKWFLGKHILHNDGTITLVDIDTDFVTIDVGVNCQATCKRDLRFDNLFVKNDGTGFCSDAEPKESEDKQ